MFALLKMKVIFGAVWCCLMVAKSLAKGEWHGLGSDASLLFCGMNAIKLHGGFMFFFLSGLWSTAFVVGNTLRRNVKDIDAPSDSSSMHFCSNRHEHPASWFSVFKYIR